MHRRDLLSTLCAALLIGSSGCSAISCRINGNYDKLRLKEVGSADDSRAIIIKYNNLNRQLQEVIDTAISNNGIRRCHDFDEEGTAIQRLETYIVGRWREAGETDFNKQENTYILHDRRYYGVELTILDANSVYSIPAEES
jgi:hypothetical protein